MVFTWEEASEMPHIEHLGILIARRWLREISALIEHHAWPYYVMIDTRAFLRSYLFQHPLGRDIVGPGVLHFEVHS